MFVVFLDNCAFRGRPHGGLPPCIFRLDDTSLIFGTHARKIKHSARLRIWGLNPFRRAIRH